SGLKIHRTEQVDAQGGLEQAVVLRVESMMIHGSSTWPSQGRRDSPATWPRCFVPPSAPTKRFLTIAMRASVSQGPRSLFHIFPEIPFFRPRILLTAEPGRLQLH